jgi:hypothetical protein
MVSPYTGLPVEAWPAKTRELIEKHPLIPNFPGLLLPQKIINSASRNIAVILANLSSNDTALQT